MKRPSPSRNLLIVASLLGSLRLTAPAEGQCRPELLGTLDAPSVSEIVVVGNVAYLAAITWGLLVVDVSDATAPVLLGSYDTPDEAGGLDVVGDVAYVADGFGGLQMIDVSDPADPVFLGRHQQPHYLRGVAVSGGVAYVAAAESGLRTIDVSDPANPVQLGSINTPGSAGRLVVSGDVAYVTASWEGLQVFDVSDPADPVWIDSFNTTSTSFDVALSGGLLYVAVGSGLEVMDISDPTDIRRIGLYELEGLCLHVSVSGDVAYVTSRERGLFALDVSDPTEPAFLGVFPIEAGKFFGTAVSGDVAYVSNYPKLRVLDVSTALGTAYCDPSAEPNVSYGQAWLGAQGSAFAADDDLTLTAVGLRPNHKYPVSIGYFIMGTGRNTFVPPGSVGPICVAPGVQRLLPGVSSTGEIESGFRRCIGTQFFPNDPILPGETWNFQAWYRVPLTPPTSNLTNAISITFQ